MDFDIIGILFFFWFIFRGIQNSKKAKRQSTQRQKSRPVPKTTPKETTTLPMPSWFPFPIEIPIEKEEKRQEAPKVKSFISEEDKLPVKQKVQEKVIPTVIEMQEKQWRNEEKVFNLNKKEVINGIIWSEVLGAPRAKRKFGHR